MGDSAGAAGDCEGMRTDRGHVFLETRSPVGERRMHFGADRNARFPTSTLERRQRRTELSSRVGLKSGPLVVEPSGEVFGDLTNAAARVQSAAGPGSILITATVQRQTTGLFVARTDANTSSRGCRRPWRSIASAGRTAAVGASGHPRRGPTLLTDWIDADQRGIMFRKMKPWTGRCMRGPSPSYRARKICRSPPWPGRLSASDDGRLLYRRGVAEGPQHCPL